jgi:hypothetical protein
MKNISDKSCRGNQNIHYVLNNLFFFSPENHAVYEILVEKYCKVGQSTDDNMAHAHYMQDT